MKNADYCNDCPNPAGCYAIGKCQMPDAKETPSSGSERRLVMLLPCPFCGNEAEVKREGTHRASMIIGCTECHCELESGDIYGRTPDDRLEWNRRIKPSQHNIQC